jgi:hypothetical protein
MASYGRWALASLSVMGEMIAILRRISWPSTLG